MTVPHYFLGWPVSSDCTEKLSERQIQLQSMASYKQFPEKQDYHITAAFLGAVEENTAIEIDTILKNWIPNIYSFDVTLGKIGAFGHANHPRVIYNHVTADERFFDHRKDLNQTLTSLGLKLDQRAFTPHITLAKKWNGDGSLDLGKLNTIVSDAPLPMSIRKLNLYKIRPSERPRYQRLKSYNYMEKPSNGGLYGTVAEN